jgi:hypothetical protein
MTSLDRWCRALASLTIVEVDARKPAFHMPFTTSTTMPSNAPDDLVEVR